MRYERGITAISWIPSEAIKGPTRLPFDMGLFNYDQPLPDVVENLDELYRKDAFRVANELRGWVDVYEGKIVDQGYLGRSLVGTTYMKIGPKRIGFPGVPQEILRPEPKVTDTSVTFYQTGGGRTAIPAPRRVKHSSLVKMTSSLAWTTLTLTINTDGSYSYDMTGASPFPRHWLYDDSGRLVKKSALIDFDSWYHESFGLKTPWGQTDTPAVIADAETALERELSYQLMHGEHKPAFRQLEPGETLVEQGDEGLELFLLLDGILAVEVDGTELARVGPGAVLGERASLESGKRNATLRAVTPVRVAISAEHHIPRENLEEVARGHRREQQHAG